MSSAESQSDIKFRCRSDKHHGKHEGKIFLKQRQVVFVSNNGAFTFSIHIEWIQGLKKAASPVLIQLMLYPGKYRMDSVIFDFTDRPNAENRLAFSLSRAAPGSMVSVGGRDVPTMSGGEKDRDMFTALLKREIEPLIAARTLDEPTLQERMLRDPVLRDTYDSLVMSGIMNEHEFWRHRNEAKLQEDTILQKRGVPSAKTDIKELTSDQQFIRYSVTKSDEEQYFQQHPTLRQLYDTEVNGGRITRQQFWTAFLEFSVTASKQHDDIKRSDHYNKFDKFEGKDNDESKRRFEDACSKNADTSVAITNDALDLYHGVYENRCSSLAGCFHIQHVSHCTLDKSTKSNDLMHKINRDSVSVMLSLKVADAEPSSKRARLVERQVLNCLEIGASAKHSSISSNAADVGRELVFPPISISVKDSVTETEFHLGPSFDILHWMKSSKQENRVHAILESELKSLVSVQFEVVSSFWLNFPPAVDDIASVKRCFRLSKALRDQWDKLIAFASKNEVDLGSLHKQVSECGLSAINESSCRFAMLFYRQFLCLNRAMCCFKNWSDQAPDKLRHAIMK